MMVNGMRLFIAINFNEVCGDRAYAGIGKLYEKAAEGFIGEYQRKGNHGSGGITYIFIRDC